jgi:succinate dehydrogenase subunit C
MATYTEGHPRWHRTRVSIYWWLGSWPYLRFILRELSSVFIAWFVVMVMLQIRALSQGPGAYKEFEEWLRSPILVALNAISFFFVLFHTITWFNLAPKAMAVRIRGKRVPDLMIAAPNYVGWLIVSVLVAWLLLGG